MQRTDANHIRRNTGSFALVDMHLAPDGKLTQAGRNRIRSITPVSAILHQAALSYKVIWLGKFHKCIWVHPKKWGLLSGTHGKQHPFNRQRDQPVLNRAASWIEQHVGRRHPSVMLPEQRAARFPLDAQTQHTERRLVHRFQPPNVYIGG